jgi:alcohol dehydrogenase
MQTHSLLLMAPRQLAWVTETLPHLKADEVLVQTKAGAISIGTELPQYLGTARSAASPHYPKMTGYESIGRIIACGSAIERRHIGDRVVAFYGHRTHAIVPEAKAIVVPDGISDAVALLAILTCDVAKGIRKVDPKPDEAVLLTGAGTIGLLTAFMLKALGINNVDVIESLTERRTLALQLGVRSAEDPQTAASKSDRYTTGFECSSRNVAFELLQRKMVSGGRICILSDGNIEPLVLVTDFHEKELTIAGSSDGVDYQGHAEWYFKTVHAYAHTLEQMFDYHTPADDLINTFEKLASGIIAPVKVLVQYNITRERE